MERLKDNAPAHSYHVTRMTSEIGSGLNDRRPKFSKLLTDPTIGVIVVEHRDRGTRFGFTYFEHLLAVQGRRLEVVFPKDSDDNLVHDGCRASLPVWRRACMEDALASEKQSK
jgi:putative resolvase